MARQLIVTLAGAARSYELMAPVYTIGRGGTADIQVVDSSISRMHARIICREADCTIEDLGSSNGTFVNGVRVAGERVIEDGDEILLGTVETRLVSDEGSDAQPGAWDRASRDAGAGSRKRRSGGALRNVLEGGASPVDIVRNGLLAMVSGSPRDVDWRLKLVSIVSGTILIGAVSIGALLVAQQRDIWEGLAAGRLQDLVAENMVGLGQDDYTLLGDNSVLGDQRVVDPLVLDSTGMVLWSRSTSAQSPGQRWARWPLRRPSATSDFIILPAGDGTPEQVRQFLIPIRERGVVLGWIAAGWDQEAAGDTGGVFALALAVGAFLILMSYVVLDRASAWVSRPIRVMSKELRSLRREDTFSVQPPRGVSELADLVNAVGTLVAAGAGPESPTVQGGRSGSNTFANWIAVPLVLVDEDYRVVDANPEACRILGIGDPHVSEVHLGRALHESYFGASLIRLLKTCAAGQTLSERLETEVGTRKLDVDVSVRRAPRGVAGYAASIVIIPA